MDLSKKSRLIGLHLMLAVGIASCSGPVLAQDFETKLVDKCCQIGRERAIESPRFNCKLSAREALSALGQQQQQQQQQTTDRASQLLVLSAERLLAQPQSQFSDKCEMVLESCCLAHHRTRNCDSGKQFAKSGSACMDVELSKEATVATESFNDCCMSCSLGILAARNPGNQSDTTASLSERCKLISPLANSLAGQLYEQTYAECCQENLPKISGALIDPSAPIDCQRAPNACSQRCLPAGTLDPLLHRRIYRDRCDCFSGYKLASDGVSCIDIDECKLNLHTCNRQSEVCDNTRGSYKCLARTATWQQQQQQQQLGSGAIFN